jgi:hypothetical protein
MRTREAREVYSRCFTSISSQKFYLRKPSVRNYRYLGSSLSRTASPRSLYHTKNQSTWLDSRGDHNLSLDHKSKKVAAAEGMLNV